MSGAGIAFYATSGTVIPVLLLAYLVQTRAAVGSFLRTIVMRSLRRRKPSFIPPMSLTAGIFLAELILLGLCLLPAIGEFAALKTLATNHVEPGAEATVVIGLATSGAAVLAPVIYTATGLDAMGPILWAYWQIHRMRQQRAAGQLSGEDFDRRRHELLDRVGVGKP
jgi:hypothetical protein